MKLGKAEALARAIGCGRRADQWLAKTVLQERHSKLLVAKCLTSFFRGAAYKLDALSLVIVLEPSPTSVLAA